MSTAIDTFTYLKRDIEQSFQRVQTISTSSHYDQQELDHLFNHISCTLDDLQKVNQLLRSSSAIPNESQSVNNPLCHLSENENDSDDENTEFMAPPHRTQTSIKDQVQQRFSAGYSKKNEEPLLPSQSNTMHTTVDVPFSSSEEREDFIRCMKSDFAYYKNRLPPVKKESQMEIVRLDQAAEEEGVNEDRMIRQQDDELEDMHHSIISLKNLSKNINFEIDDHLRVLNNLETGIVDSQNQVTSLTNRTKDFLRTSAGGVGGHTCLFATAVGLFLLIVILILFF